MLFFIHQKKKKKLTKKPLTYLFFPTLSLHPNRAKTEVTLYKAPHVNLNTKNKRKRKTESESFVFSFLT
jgi:hypothetical protein